VSNTSYFVRRQSAFTDYTEFDRSVFLGNPYVTDPAVSAPTEWADDQDNFTQEFRLTKNDPSAALNWTVGVFYQHSKENTVENVYDPFILNQLGLPLGDGYIYKQNPFLAVDKQLAVFGQADLKLSPRVKATLGVRYSNAEFSSDTYYSGFVVGPPVSSQGTLKEHPVTPKLGINFQVTPDNLLYASAAKGFRVGGANPAIGIFCGLQPGPYYNSDSVWSYEVGSKNQSSDHKLMLDTSAYIIKWKNVQQNVYLPCGFQFTDNLGNAESKGFDMAFSLKLWDAFWFGGTVAYTSATYTEDVLKVVSGQTLPIAQNGDHLAGAPWNLAVWGQANFAAFGGDGYVRMDFQHNEEQRDRTPEQNPANYTYQLWRRGLPSVDNLSLRAGVNYGRLDVSAFVTNLTNSLPALTRNQDVGTPAGGTPLFYDITQRPRTFGVTATYRY
jgi:outer membrane receptor protein involved in Fe transport